MRVVPSLGLVVISVEGLRRFCGREKTGSCNEIMGRCAPFSFPQIII